MNSRAESNININLIVLILKSNDFYLGDLFRIGRSGLQDLDLLVDIWRIQPAGPVSAFTSTLPQPGNVNGVNETIVSISIYQPF